MSQRSTTPRETHERTRLAVLSRLVRALTALLILVASPHALAQEDFEITPEERAWLDAHPGIRVAPAPNFPPLEYFDDEGVYQGVMAEYTRILEQKLGIEFEIVRYDTWSDVVTATKALEVDMWLEAQDTPERREFLNLTRPYVDLPIVIIVRRELTGSLELADLVGLNVAVIEGYASSEFVRTNYPELQLIPVPTIEDGLERVSFGAADVLIANIGTASHYIEKKGMTNLRVAGTSGIEWNLCIAARKDWPELHSILQRALDSIPMTQRQEIYRQWIALEPPKAGLASNNLTVVLVSLGVLGVVMFLLLRRKPTTTDRTYHRSDIARSWPIIATGVAAIAVVIIAGRLGWSVISTRATRDVGNAQSTVLTTTSQAVFDWIKARQQDTRELTQRGSISDYAASLLNTDTPTQSRATARDGLYQELSAFTDSSRYETFALVNLNGQNLFNTIAGYDFFPFDESICADLVAQLTTGEKQSAVRMPERAESSGAGSSLQELLLIASPITDASGEAIGALVLGVDTEGDFTTILQRGRMGESGESYGFNQQGQMISESRFDEDLKRLGVIGINQRSILNVALRDPGGNLTRGFTPTIPTDQLPLTHMAEQATTGNTGSDLEGYNDYRGVPVIGSWVWDENTGLGIATEIDVAEAYELRSAFTRQAFVGTALAVGLIAGLTVMFLWSRIQMAATNNQLADAFAIIKKHSMRMEEELNVGRDIQMSMVPLIFPAFPDHEEFSISAAIIPAREVGGDFYDFFFIDDEHLCVSIGDVSGKGVPSALFMAVTQTLIRSRAMDDISTSRVLSQVNNRLSERNETCMFVTEFLAVLNTRTGEMTYTNAGHNPPMIRRIDGSVERLRDRHGPIIGASEGLEYRSSSTTLEPGDVLVTYTDGVTEAMNPGKELFTEDRLAELLESEAPESDKQALDKTIDAIRAFENGAEQADDITILTLLYRGAAERSVQRRFEISIQNRKDEITRVSEFFENFVTPHGLTDKVRRSFGIVFDELLSNVISHGYKDEEVHQIDIKVEINTQRIVVTITDDGHEFNPLEQAAPQTDLSIEERTIGGDGIEIVRRLVDTIEYERRGGRNLIKITKEIGS